MPSSPPCRDTARRSSSSPAFDPKECAFPRRTSFAGRHSTDYVRHAGLGHTERTVRRSFGSITPHCFVPQCLHWKRTNPLRRVPGTRRRAQARLHARLGVSFVYLSDEWYLRLGEDVPSLQAYDGLDLAENGVGLTRQFLETVEWEAESRITNHGSRTLVTGTLFAPVLQQVTAGFAGVDVVPVINRFFGETVTVAGLLTGQDVVEQ